MDVCDAEKVAHPIIVSESGRAIVAHHSVLIVEAFGSIEKDRTPIQIEVKESDPKQVSEMLEIQRNITQQNRMESLHDAQQIKEQAQSMFDLGLLELEEQGEDRDRLLADRETDRGFLRGHEIRAGRGEGTRGGARRSIRLQFLRLPEPARSLGARAALSR